MPVPRPSAAGGFRSIWYTIAQARSAGGLRRMWRALRSKNACKTCALGMGGQAGGMVNERGHFPEVCKKSVQAMAADMRGRLSEGYFDEFPHDRLARLSPRELEAAGRITRPVFSEAGADRYREVSWERALVLAADALRGAPSDETFFYASGRSSNEAGFLLQLFARLYGTNNVNNCSYFCHQASGVGLRQAIGTGTGTVALGDLDASDLVLLIGANPASNHPRLMRTLMDLKRRGGKVVAINPIRELGLVNFAVPSDARSLLFGTRIADAFLQPHIGGDIALLSAIAKGVIELGAADARFIAEHTEGHDAWRAVLDGLDWPTLVRESGVPEPEVRAAAQMYAESRAAVFCWTMGITHHAHGVENVNAISNLALLRGMLGKAGAGLLPLRGHSNVQGMGTVGVSPVPSEAFLRGLERRFGVTMPTASGMDTLACVRAAEAGRVRVAVHLGGNLFGSCPDAGLAERALGSVDLTVFLSTTLNTGHARGRGKASLILPVLARDEEAQPTTQESMFSFVRYSEGGRARFEGPRSEVEVIADLMRRTLGERLPEVLADATDHAAIRAHIAAVIPELEALGTIDQTRREFQIPGRAVASPVVSTPTGRAAFKGVPLPTHEVSVDDLAGSGSAPSAGIALRLATIRSEGQFNTVVYEDHDVYRGQVRRDVVMMSRGDMERLGVGEDDPVEVASAVGTMVVRAREIEIRPGNAAMYCPEANVLVPATADPRSRTPAFKNVAVRIRRSLRLGVLPASAPADTVGA
ncbi:MAG: FdhF/YdeP family oxidoreductase [Phycisphaerales bacterium]|nr:FdhF/YdeP family oxidoreductase [Phycisphaerales bacterium]